MNKEEYLRVFKIRDKESGLFSNGGQYPRFTSRGKAWGTLNDLKLHLAQFKRKLSKRPYGYRFDEKWKSISIWIDDIEIIVFTEDGLHFVDLNMMDELK